MKAEELKIKNWVSDGIFIFLVSEISKDGIIKGISICVDGVDALEINDRWRLAEQYSLNIENIQPIAITEEWLKRFGFEQTAENIGSFVKTPPCAVPGYGLHFKFHSQHPRPHPDKLFNAITEVSYFEQRLYVREGIKYVHQLQNLYYALTGSDLTIPVSEKPLSEGA